MTKMTISTTAFAACALLAFASTVQAQLRPRASVMIGLGVDAPSCNIGCSTMTAASGSVEAGASYDARYWGVVRVTGWAEPDLVEQGPYTGSFIGVIGGYQLLEQVAVYGGIGRNAESWGGDNVTSNGAAVALGGEVVLGRATGIGLRLQGELIHSMTGSRVTNTDNLKVRGDFRPRLMHVSVGIVWR